MTTVALGAAAAAAMSDPAPAAIALSRPSDLQITRPADAAATPNRSGDHRRRSDAEPGSLTLGDTEAQISLSFYSLSSEFFGAEEVETFLAAVRDRAPRRSLAVLTDAVLEAALAKPAARLGVELIATHGRRFSPWPRDPLSFLRSPEGGVVALLRPNRQILREDDALMARALIEGLPQELDRALGEPRWQTSAIPFHNGNILPSDGRLWISLHTLEPRILEIMGLDRVPVTTFADPRAVGRYLDTARRAAAELAPVFGLPVEWIHPLPDNGTAEELAAEMFRLGGGAGFDLDSVLTLLPTEGGELRALVADPRLGADLVGRIGDGSLRDLALAYGLTGETEALRRSLLSAQGERRASGLSGFLDLVADDLGARGIEVRRLPLLLVPIGLLRPDLRHQGTDFLIGWNNVVLEHSAAGRRAEGFASGLPAGDALAIEEFASLGYELDLLPPLFESIRRSGGYRCASNHIRVALKTAR